MRIAEIFHSIQGEGKLSGTPSVFVRVSGCNLRCHWCDTPYASWHPEGEQLSIDEIVERVEGYACRHVVITGGEPLIMPELDALCWRFVQAGHHLTLETAGTLFRPLPLHLASVSPKLSNSTPTAQEAGALALQHEQRRLNLPAIQRFIDTSPDIQLKFVVDRPADMHELDGLLSQLRGWRAEDVLLMPQGTEPADLSAASPWLIEACKQRGFRFCPRLHAMVWGPLRGV